MLFQIPDNILAYPAFSSTVALENREALSRKPGLNETFATLMPHLDHLVCAVREFTSTPQTIELFDVNGQDIASELVRMCNLNNLARKPKAMLPAPPPFPKIEASS